jgi:hypothetical protein
MRATAQENQLRAVRSEIAERCYRWAAKDARREIEDDCVLLRTVKSQAAYRFLEMIEPMRKNERLKLVTALVRRFHIGGPASASRVSTAEDQLLIAKYLEYDDTEVLPGLRAKSLIIRDGGTKRLATGPTSSRVPKIDRAALHSAIVEKLRPVCGGKLVDLGPGSSLFESPVGPWIVSTQFSTASRFRHFDYWHRIMVPEGIIVGEGISILRWLGISGMSSWTLKNESEVEGAVADLAGICSHFLRSVPLLLRGIRPPIPNAAE